LHWNVNERIDYIRRKLRLKYKKKINNYRRILVAFISIRKFKINLIIIIVIIIITIVIIVIKIIIVIIKI
jgi:hypothetical protein